MLLTVNWMQQQLPPTVWDDLTHQIDVEHVSIFRFGCVDSSGTSH